jgi:hypothetical protein
MNDDKLWKIVMLAGGGFFVIFVIVVTALGSGSGDAYEPTTRHTKPTPRTTAPAPQPAYRAPVRKAAPTPTPAVKRKPKCKKGKPCGNSCIARDKVCHK